MADCVLREPCDHGRYEPHHYGQEIPTSWRPCLGGREVTIDYEAAANELWESFKDQADTVEAAKSVVGAALGWSDG